MFDWFSTLAAGSELPMDTAYTAAVASAIGDDITIGSTSTRVSDFVNRYGDCSLAL